LYCSGACRQKSYRRRKAARRWFPAHQRRIRERLAASHPRPAQSSLESYTVEVIHRERAAPIIEQYEWLGCLARNSEYFVGLIAPDGDLQGVASFGHGPGGPIRDLIGEPALCLDRGACVHYAPKNAASFLINRACKLIHKLKGIPLFFAYADPLAGEYGGVYQAAGWLYLGQGLNGIGRMAASLKARPVFAIASPAPCLPRENSATARNAAPSPALAGPGARLAFAATLDRRPARPAGEVGHARD
jgi:hypothetical protein